jgi:pyridoxine/pyridoxamine 5'-phosphate oxidase
MTLATYDEHFGADARIVLLKEVVRNEFVFYQLPFIEGSTIDKVSSRYIVILVCTV